MKRIGDLYGKIIDIENLRLADQKARKGKSKSKGVIIHDKNKESNILNLHKILSEKRFRNSQYKVFILHQEKDREIFCLPYFPDRILHHAIMNVLQPIWMSIFTKDTYQCIPGRGISLAMKRVVDALKDKKNTKYCLKFDIKKFYPSIDHDILKSIIRKKIKCADTLNLLDEIIDSAPGVPIGNYLSQYFANLYLAYFDHYVVEVLKLKYYFRYCDDMVILGPTKEYLHEIFESIKPEINSLKLEIKSNYQIFPISKFNGRGLDFLGFVFYHDHRLLRKRIKLRFKNMLKKLSKSPDEVKKIHLSAYWGWLKQTNSKNLIKKLKDEGKL